MRKPNPSYEGRKAYRRGQSSIKNPYFDTDREAADSWRFGYYDEARREEDDEARADYERRKPGL